MIIIKMQLKKFKLEFCKRSFHMSSIQCLFNNLVVIQRSLKQPRTWRVERQKSLYVFKYIYLFFSVMTYFLTQIKVSVLKIWRSSDSHSVQIASALLIGIFSIYFLPLIYFFFERYFFLVKTMLSFLLKIQQLKVESNYLIISFHQLARLALQYEIRKNM